MPHLQGRTSRNLESIYKRSLVPRHALWRPQGQASRNWSRHLELLWPLLPPIHLEVRNRVGDRNFWWVRLWKRWKRFWWRPDIWYCCLSLKFLLSYCKFEFLLVINSLSLIQWLNNSNLTCQKFKLLSTWTQLQPKKTFADNKSLEVILW
jgi:hypothetical protein